MTLGRLEILDSGTPTLLYDVQHSKLAGHYDAHSNMVLSCLTPLVLVHVPGSGALMRMELDTGSNITTFTNLLCGRQTLRMACRRCRRCRQGAPGPAPAGGDAHHRKTSSRTEERDCELPLKCNEGWSHWSKHIP